jgi:hypothetical protein
MNVYLHIHTCIHVRVHVNVYFQTSDSMVQNLLHPYTYIHTYSHAYKREHTHTHTQSCYDPYIRTRTSTRASCRNTHTGSPQYIHITYIHSTHRRSLTRFKLTTYIQLTSTYMYIHAGPWRHTARSPPSIGGADKSCATCTLIPRSLRPRHVCISCIYAQKKL